MRCVLRPRVVGIGGKHLCYDCDENDVDDDRDVELSARNWIGIQWRADEIYARKFCAALVDLLVIFVKFW